MSAARRRIDWSFGPGHGPVSGVLNAAAGVLVLTMFAWLYDGSPWWSALLGIGMAAAGAGVAAYYDQRGRVVAYRAACWLLVGFWSWWTLLDFHGWYLLGQWHIMEFWSSPLSPWTWRAAMPLVIGTAILGTIGWRMDVAERREIAERERLAAERAAQLAEAVERDRIQREPQNPQEEIGFRWEPAVKRILGKDVNVVAIEVWDEGHGFTLDCALPDDGTVLSDVKRHEESLAAAAPENPDGEGGYQGLGDGCGVEILPSPGMGRRNFLIKVTTVTALAQDIPYPDDLSMETIRNGVSLGRETDFGDARIPALDETTVLIGNTDSGKSNELNVLTTGYARCTDVLLVAIDTSGNGRMPRPWNMAYAQGKARKPIFAKIAPTDHHARLLMAMLRNIIDGRTTDYAAMMAAANSDTLPVSPGVPLIMLVVDEFKRLPDDIRESIVDLVETGRGPRVRGTFCALEATQAAMPRQIIKHSRNRIGMRVVDETELMYLFDTSWRRGRFDPASMPWKGSGLYANGPSHPAKFKGYRIDPARIFQMSIDLGEYRPELDELSYRRANTVTIRERVDGVLTDVTYDNVWDNFDAETYPLIFSGIEGAGATGAGTAASSSSGGSTATITKGAPTMTSSHTGDPAGDFAQGLREMNDAGKRTDDIIAQLEQAAAAGDGGLAYEQQKAAEAAAGDQGDEGGEDGSRTRPRPAPPATPSAADLAAMLPDLAGLGATPPATSSTTSPPVPPSTPPPAGPVIIPAGEGKAQGGPAPGRRILQLIHLAGTDGTGPTAIHATLVAEGYPTSITTVQNKLRDWRIQDVVRQVDGKGSAYVAGAKFPIDRL